MLGFDFMFLLVKLKSLFKSPFLYYLLAVNFLTLSKYGYGVLSLLATGIAKLLVLDYFFKPKPLLLVDFFNSGVLIGAAAPPPLLNYPLLADALLAKNFLLLTCTLSYAFYYFNLASSIY